MHPANTSTTMTLPTVFMSALPPRVRKQKALNGARFIRVRSAPCLGQR
jgi:hypothetical protein